MLPSLCMLLATVAGNPVHPTIPMNAVPDLASATGGTHPESMNPAALPVVNLNQTVGPPAAGTPSSMQTDNESVATAVPAPRGYGAVNSSTHPGAWHFMYRLAMATDKSGARTNESLYAAWKETGSRDKLLSDFVHRCWRPNENFTENKARHLLGPVYDKPLQYRYLCNYIHMYVYKYIHI